MRLKAIRRFLLLFVASLLCSSLAYAGQGFIAFNIGHQTLKSRSTSSSAAYFLNQPLAGNGFVYGLAVGYDGQYINNIILGIQLSGRISHTRVSSITDVSNGGVLIVRDDTIEKLRGSYAIDLRGGYNIFSRTKVYGLIGLRRGRFKTQADATGFASVINSHSSLGWEFGGGVALSLNKHFNIHADYTFTRYKTWYFTAYGSSLRLSPRAGTLEVGLSYQFGQLA